MRACVHLAAMRANEAEAWISSRTSAKNGTFAFQQKGNPLGNADFEGSSHINLCLAFRNFSMTSSLESVAWLLILMDSGSPQIPGKWTSMT